MPAATPPAAPTDATSPTRPLPPVLGKLLRGTFWLALRTPLQAVFALWRVPLTMAYLGKAGYAAYTFALGFGFLQFLIEFGMSSALQRRVSETWTQGDEDGLHRAISAGMTWYTAMAAIQAAVLLGFAYLSVAPDPDVAPGEKSLIMALLWLQAVTAPCYGISTVVGSVLQAARRYDFIPKIEFAIVLAQFAILVGGLRALAGIPALARPMTFFWIVVASTLVQIGLSLGPSVWVMVRDLKFVPRFRGAGRADYATLLKVSVFVFLIQLSVVLSTSIDTTVLWYALGGEARTLAMDAYGVVSRPFLQVRQIGWTLAYFVMPAVASLVAARDDAGLERVKYDGPRMHIGVLMPVGLLAWIYAAPFLDLWVGRQFAAPGEIGELAGLLRLFLIAALPLAAAVHVQMAIGMGRIGPIAIAALAGAVINLPISYLLTRRIGVAGVIWGTVLTTLLANGIAPLVYTCRVLKIRASTLLARTLAPPLLGTLALLAATWALRLAWPPSVGAGTLSGRSAHLVIHLTVGCLAYAAGYLAAPAGRGDAAVLRARLIRRPAPSAAEA